MIERLQTPLARLAAMDAAELGFRLRGELHKRVDGARWRLARPTWNRASLRHALAHAAPDDSLFLSATRSAVETADWAGAHRALARHITHRAAPFPLEPGTLEALAAGIRARIPTAADHSAARADRILAGRYDLLGYTGLDFGSPPAWDYDPVHQRRAPGGFWAAVPFLDPASGDHKVIWEVNRHQHWLALGRAYQLSGDARYYEAFVRQLEDWLEANPPLTGVNWASMLELAFRALSWLWALQFFAPAAVDEQDAAAPWMVDMLVALDRQLTHIERNLSRYFSPNTHLTGEALALYVGGMALPELRASARRAAIGRDMLLAEAARQVRADGGHVERSAHYHRYSTDFYLLALQVARAGRDPAAAAFADAARAQASYLRTLADDTGRLPLLGDDDGGQLFPICGRPPADCRDTLAAAAVLLDDPRLAIGDAPEEVFWLCKDAVRSGPAVPAPPPWPSTALPDSGYYVSRTPEGDHLVFDAGPHGFLNGGHAHSDALAIVATIGGTPLLVDPGTATYTMDPASRDRFRSTAMHNTVVVNGRPQSEPKGPFHWQTTADATASIWRTGEGADYMEARHGAYAPLVHARAVLALHGRAWFVIDHFLHPDSGDERAATDSFWHLHPEWTLVSPPGTTVLLRHAGGQTHGMASSEVMTPVQGTPFADLAAHAPVYGRIEPAECLHVTTDGPLPRSVLTVVPMAGCQGPEVFIEPLTLAEPPAPGWHAVAYRVRIDDGEAVLLASIERSGVPAADLAAPPSRWGTGDVQIVGRVALLFSSPAGWDTVVVNGRHEASGTAKLNHDLTQPLIRMRRMRSEVVGARRPVVCTPPSSRSSGR